MKLTVARVVAAFDYMLLRRLISTYIPDATTLRVPARWLTRIFVACDILSFLTQSTGAGILAGAKNDMSKSKLGERVLMSGLILQVVAFGFFAALIVRFHVKMIVLGASKNWNGRWQPLLFCLYGSCALVTLRKYPFIIEIFRLDRWNSSSCAYCTDMASYEQDLSIELPNLAKASMGT